MSTVQLQPTNETVLLNSEERHRMTRLYEEVLTRLEEMAMITARNLGMPAAVAGEVLFHPIASRLAGGFHAVEVLRGSLGSGCYDYAQGSCFEFNPQLQKE